MSEDKGWQKVQRVAVIIWEKWASGIIIRTISFKHAQKILHPNGPWNKYTYSTQTQALLPVLS